MAGGVERGGEHIEQLTFDSLTEAPTDNAEALQWGTSPNILAKASGEVRRSAPSRRKAKKPLALDDGVQQHTLDELFAIMPMEVDIPLAIPTRETHDNEKRPLKQLTFETLAELPSEDAGTIAEREPSGSGTGEDSQSALRSDVRVGGSQENGLFIGLGDSNRAIPFAGRRVIPGEPELEPERKRSRDFRGCKKKF